MKSRIYDIVLNLIVMVFYLRCILIDEKLLILENFIERSDGEAITNQFFDYG